MFVQLVEIVFDGIGPKTLQDAKVASTYSFTDCRPAEERFLALF